MTDSDYAQKLAQLDRLLDDPNTPMQPGRVWALLAEISEHDAARAHRISTGSAGAGSAG